MKGSRMSTSVVVPFPLSARTALVRQTAHALLVMNRARAEPYWKRAVRKHRKELALRGLTEAQQDMELLTFHSAVDAAMRARVVQPCGSPGGEAA